MLGQIGVLVYLMVQIILLFHKFMSINYSIIKHQTKMFLLGSKTLGLNVLELQFVTLANHDQNVLVFVLDLLKVCLYVKLELMFCRIYCVNLLGSIDRELDLIDRKSCRLFFLQNFQLSPSPLRIKVSDLLLPVYKGNLKHIFRCAVQRDFSASCAPLWYLGFCTQNLSKVAQIVICVNLL